MYPHDHAAVLASDGSSFRFAAVKKALLKRHGLASHWSCTHSGYWSAVRYCSVPSPSKPASALDENPVLWASHGQHPPLHECRSRPLTASALMERSERKFRKAAEEGKAEKITELDVWPVVVENNFRDGPDEFTAHLKLMSYAKTCCSPAMQAFLFKRRCQLPSLIQSIWQWEDVDAVLDGAARSRLDTLRAAAAGSCVCGGKWPAVVATTMVSNGISLKELCRDVYTSMDTGRSETTPVLVLAGSRGGEGKSFFLKPLEEVFGSENVLPCPEPGSFPLLDLPGKKVVFLDGWRFNRSVLPYETQCRWYDGSTVSVQRPLNQNGVTGHVSYRGTAPIFVTTKLDDIKRLERLSALNPTTGEPEDANASMCFRRLKVYKFSKRIEKPQSKIKFCPKCFAELVLTLGQPPAGTFV